MKDLEMDICSGDVMKVCETVAHYTCQKKVKQLITFYLTQLNDYYISNNVMLLMFVSDRVTTIKSNTFEDRITKVSLCELFVVMTLLKRKEKQKWMLSPSKCSIECSAIYRQNEFMVTFRGHKIPCSRYVMILKELCNLDYNHEDIVICLIYSCTIEYNAQRITQCLSILFKYTTVIKMTSLKKQQELSHIHELPNHFHSILYFIALGVSNKNIYHSRKIVDMLMLKPHFNLMLTLFNVSYLPHFEKAYYFDKSFYSPIVFQCAMKIGFLYKDLYDEEYSNLTMKKESIIEMDDISTNKPNKVQHYHGQNRHHNGNNSPNTPHENNNISTNEKSKDTNQSHEEDQDYDPLFTIPEMKGPEKLKMVIIPPKSYETITIVLKTNNNNDKNSITLSSKNK